ncbi:site-specific recombinase XerD [Lutibacter sp. Hel_I_33_5]|uniref:tyrosine-type recombinase/integrase n=1 Tax=Lutibacter sp. Hel_I_33_5 TaxID=1566289 RepID=UPI0011A73122|nr:site-specific integrase [Lutibacter sp. Hel_I_33_5]TVZ56065.1 site-specific recombinase XerD [Lutibacter sp. Hel_I_33_5]
MKKLPTLFISKGYHKKEHLIIIKFDYNEKLIALIKSIKGIRWSQTLKAWHLKNNPENLQTLHTLFKDITIIDSSQFFKKQINIIKKNEPIKRNLDATQKEFLNDFYKYLRGKRYSKSTMDSYTFYVADFISFYHKKPLSEINNRDVEIYIETIFIKRNYAVSTQRQFISALKVFIVFCSTTQINSLELVRPKKHRRLPNVISQEEVLDIIRFTKNLKHRAAITLLYSCGLRISELINLKLKNIDVDRKQLRIENSKGRKDRYVSLADSFLPLFSNYFYTFSPINYFIEGKEGEKYSAESVRQFLKRSCKLAKISKVVTPHTLRHSYATHLLENGVDIRYIQSLLGHARPETTMIYTHVKRKDLLEISNPLDMAIKKIKQTDNNKANVLLSRKLT